MLLPHWREVLSQAPYVPLPSIYAATDTMFSNRTDCQALGSTENRSWRRVDLGHTSESFYRRASDLNGIKNSEGLYNKRWLALYHWSQLLDRWRGEGSGFETKEKTATDVKGHMTSSPKNITTSICIGTFYENTSNRLDFVPRKYMVKGISRTIVELHR